jgi:hypothetical protein
VALAQLTLFSVLYGPDSFGAATQDHEAPFHRSISVWAVLSENGSLLYQPVAKHNLAFAQLSPVCALSPVPGLTDFTICHFAPFRLSMSVCS